MSIDRVKEATRILVAENGRDRYCHSGRLLLASKGYTDDEAKRRGAPIMSGSGIP